MQFVTFQMILKFNMWVLENINTTSADLSLMNSCSVSHPLFLGLFKASLGSVAGGGVLTRAQAGAFKQWFPRSREARPWN